MLPNNLLLKKLHFSASLEMAYAALISLANTIHRFLNHDQLSISHEEKRHLVSLLEHVTHFQSFLDEFPDKFNTLEGRMRDAANEAEDILEYLMLEKLFPSSDDPSGKHELQLKKVMEEIDLIAKEVKEIKDISCSSSKVDVESSAADSSGSHSSSSMAPPTRKDSMVGFQDYALDIKERLCGETSKLQVIPICGMGGVGKTTLARNVYDDPLIVEHFVLRVWVTVSQDFSAERIFSSILESLKEYSKDVKGQSDDEKVHKILVGRRYLIVMDDMWSSEAWDAVRRVFPDDGNASRVMLTTRLYDVASYPDRSSKLHEMSLLSEDQSWDLFKQKVFADEDFPSELENIGKEIATSCKGLPLAIVVIAGLLSTVSKNPASWREIAGKVKSTETAEHGQIEEILSLSYVQLPQYLRPCFLYMASFPEDEEIHLKRLVRLWIAEGFVESPIDSDCFEKVAEKCLEKLVKRNLVLVTKRKCDGGIKSCSLHDLMRDLCIRKARETNFFLNFMDADIEEACFMESIRNQRRVSIKSSYLSFLSSYGDGDGNGDGSTIHSIRCSSFDTVKLKFVKGVRLLRVLDAEHVYVDRLSSPHQLCELSRLRYLAIRLDRVVPRGLAKLENMQSLIVCGAKRPQFGGSVPWMLRWNWCTPRLRHVYFHGTIEFEDPDETNSSLPLESLQTLTRVRHSCCTERILRMIPNVKTLKIDCSRGVHREGGVAWLDDLAHLHRLEILEIYAGRWLGHRPKQYKITYPSLLKRLTLRDLRLPWSDMIAAGSLPNLQVLKLKGCTCVGGTWETMEGVFPMLEVLMIRLSTFENWITEGSHFPRLKRLLIDSCKGLNGIPSDIGEIATLELIEVKCRVIEKSLIESVEQIQEEQEELGNDGLRVLCFAK